MAYSSRKAYTGTSDSNHATYDDDQDSSHHPLRHSDCRPRRKVTVTRYCIDTAGDFMTSYYDCREFTACGAQRPSSSKNIFSDDGYRDPARLPKVNSRLPETSFERLSIGHTYSYRPRQGLRIPDEPRDDRHSKPNRSYSSDHDTIPEKRSSRGPLNFAGEGQRFTNSAHSRHPQQDKLTPAYESDYSGILRSHSRYKDQRSDHHIQEKPDNGRSNGQRQRDFRSNRNDPYYNGCEQRYYRGNSNLSQPRESEHTSRDNNSGRSEGYSSSRFATKHRAGQGKPEGGSIRSQGKSYSTRSANKGKGVLGSDTSDSSHAIPKTQAKAQGNFPDLYAILKSSHCATDEEIKSAAKRRRVEVHADKLKLSGMSVSKIDEIDAVAARVGQAADVLLKYDHKLYEAKILKEHGM